MPAKRRKAGGVHLRRGPKPVDVVTPTPREARLADLARRRRRYVLVIVPVLVLVAFGFFVPAPVAFRVVALVVAAVLAPVAAILGNARGRS